MSNYRNTFTLFRDEKDEVVFILNGSNNEFVLTCFRGEKELFTLDALAAHTLFEWGSDEEKNGGIIESDIRVEARNSDHIIFAPPVKHTQYAMKVVRVPASGKKNRTLLMLDDHQTGRLTEWFERMCDRANIV